MCLRSGTLNIQTLYNLFISIFLKYFLGVNSSVNNTVAFGECGRLPPCETYFTNCIKHWCKLLHMQNNRYPKKCYKMLKALDEADRQNWVSKVRNLLFT